MFKLVLEKAEEPEIKLSTYVGSLKKQESSRKASISDLLTMPKPFDCVDYENVWKILQKMGIPDHLTCLLSNLHAVQEATVRMTWNNRLVPNQEGVHQGCILLLCLFNLCRVHHMKCGADEAQAGIKIAGRNISNLRYADYATVMAETEEELNSLLMT